MKKALPLIMFICALTISFLVTAFTKATFDVVVWGEDARMMCAVFGVFIGFIAAMFTTMAIQD